MIRRIGSEIKIIGINFFIVSAVFSTALVVFSAIAGELLDFYPVSYEVIFPFFTAIAVGEWGKTGADSNYDIIAAQSRSLFGWVLIRYVTVFGLSGTFAVLSMAGSSIVRYEFPLWELLAIYFPPAFFLSSLCALIGLQCRQEHAATLVCGIVWLVTLLSSSLLRISGTEYFYLFIRYVGDPDHIWLWNKGIIAAVGLFLWGIIYRKCEIF